MLWPTSQFNGAKPHQGTTGPTLLRLQISKPGWLSPFFALIQSWSPNFPSLPPPPLPWVRPLLCHTAKAPCRVLTSAFPVSCRAPFLLPGLTRCSPASVAPPHRSIPFLYSMPCPIPIKQSRTIAVFHGLKSSAHRGLQRSLHPPQPALMGRLAPPSSEQAMCFTLTFTNVLMPQICLQCLLSSSPFQTLSAPQSPARVLPKLHQCFLSALNSLGSLCRFTQMV